MNKEKSDKLKAQISKEKSEEEMKNALDQAEKIIGKSLPIHKFASTDDDPILSIEDRNGKYTINEKHLALMFMQGIQKEVGSRLVPRYTPISRMLGVPKQTLSNWWADRETLEKQHSTVMEQGVRYIGHSLIDEMFRMVSALKNIDYVTLFDKPGDLKNFVSLFNVVSNKALIYNKMSTSKVEHEHTGGVAMIVPD